jgi:thioredoxin-like negative regulator of GroEL
MSQMELTIEETLHQGVSAHQEGRHQDAERFYRSVLLSQPSHPDANHNLGVLAVSFNQTEAALPLFKTALDANPNIEQFWLSYIDALTKTNQVDTARIALERSKAQGVTSEKLDALEAQLQSISNQRAPKNNSHKKKLTLSEKRKQAAERKKK